MNVTIGRAELIALCKSIEDLGDKVSTANSDTIERRPFTNGNHWRFKQSFLDNATDEQLADIYGSVSDTFKVKKECDHQFVPVGNPPMTGNCEAVCNKCGYRPQSEPQKTLF